MLGRTLPTAVAGLLVAGLLSIASPAGAVEYWSFDERPDGFPAAGAAPAQTLTSARANLHGGAEGAFDATVELGAVPDESSAARLVLDIGSVQDGSCVSRWTLSVSTLDTSGPASRDGAAISIHTGANDEPGAPCGSVSVVAPDGTVVDRLDETEGSTAIADPSGRTKVTQVRGTTVRCERWSTVWAQVEYTGADADGVRVSGSGQHLRARSHVVRIGLESGDRIWVPLRVRVDGPQARRLRIVTSPVGDLAFVHPRIHRVRIRPAC